MHTTRHTTPIPLLFGRSILALVLSMLIALPLRAAAGGRPFTFDDLMAIRRLSDPQISPDGRWVAFTVTTVDKAKNTRNTDVWLLPTTGGEPRPLTTHPAADVRPRWSPDGTRLAFVSTRAGTPQIWTITVAGGEPEQLTRFPTGASGVLWSPDGQHVAFTAEVYPDCPDEACTRQREEERARHPVKARIYTRLLYRHWDTWKDGKRRHLFVIPVVGGTARDLTPGDHDVPPFSLGGPDDYAFSPDGSELCFAKKESHDEAISTNTDLWIVSVRGGEPRRLTTNPAADNSPLYSPDGRYIAYRAQERPGFESDRWRLMLYDRRTGRTRSLTDALDHWVEEFVWAPDSQRLYFTVAEGGAFPIYVVTISTGEIRKLVPTGANEGLQITPDGKTLIFLRHGFSQPAELYRVNVDGSQLTPLTRMNADRLAEIQWGDVRSIWYTGAEGARVHGWIVTPPGFDSTRKYPMIVLLHGGPQSVWADVFHYRWNAQLFAAAGYVLFLPNPRGSIGFGQKFIDEISGDWGGKVYEDVMRGVDHVLSLGYVDPNRIGAAGGSYGGYLVNWIAGHTDRFRALVSHAGVFNLISMYGSTEELWFPEWEFRGTPWTNKELYERWSPHNVAQNFKTPTLVIHGELDFRVPVSEGLQMFTALQRQNVPSKLLLFPDEGHWILKPQNSELWYRTVIEWFDTYLKAPGS